MSKIIVNLGSKICEKNDTFTCQLTCLHNWLLMSIFETPEKDLSNVDSKSDMRKLRTSSVKLSSTLFSCSILAIYNRINPAKKTSHPGFISDWDEYIGFTKETLRQ